MEAQQIEKHLVQYIQETNVNIYDLQIGDGGVQLISTNPTYHICLLSLMKNRITYQGISYFSKADWSNLTFLNLGDNQIGAKGCKYLTKTPLPSLQILGLRRNRVGVEGIIHLSKASWKLLQINLGQSRMGSVGMRWLIRIYWIMVKSIIIQNNDLTIEAMHNLVLSNFTDLKSLYRCNSQQELLINMSEQEKVKAIIKAAFPRLFLRI